MENSNVENLWSDIEYWFKQGAIKIRTHPEQSIEQMLNGYVEKPSQIEREAFIRGCKDGYAEMQGPHILDSVPVVEDDLVYLQTHVFITKQDIEALLQGKILEINDHDEYQVYISLGKE